MAATAAVGAWTKPVLVAWGGSGRLFPFAHAQRLSNAFPHAELYTIADSSTYVMVGNHG